MDRSLKPSPESSSLLERAAEQRLQQEKARVARIVSATLADLRNARRIDRARNDVTTLFQSADTPRAPLTPESVSAWADALKQRVGPDLQDFDVRMTRGDDLFLEAIIVSRGAQREGLGSKVMLELTRFADQNGKRITLSPAEKGYQDSTTSKSRLVKFYKRFGFVENKGRNLDLSLPEQMYREPNVTDMAQPLHHGSPHDFERFSTEKIGTGEGAAAYGWGLYFAENRKVAEGYHERLAGAPPLEELKLGTLRMNEANGFDYSSRAHLSDKENIRASLAEDSATQRERTPDP